MERVIFNLKVNLVLFQSFQLSIELTQIVPVITNVHNQQILQ